MGFCGESWCHLVFLRIRDAGNDGVVVAKTWTDLVIRVAAALSLAE